MGLPFEKGSTKNDRYVIDVPETCPFCGNSLSSSDKAWSGCPLCAKEEFSERGAQNILDLSNSLRTHNKQQLKRLPRSAKKSKVYQKHLIFDSFRSESNTSLNRIKKIGSLACLGLIIGALICHVYLFYPSSFQLIEPVVQFPKNLIIDEVKLFKSADNFKLKFSVRNEDLTHVVALKIAVGVFDHDGDIVSTLIFDILKGSSNIYQSKRTGIAPGESKTFTVIIPFEVAKVAIIPFEAEMFI